MDGLRDVVLFDLEAGFIFARIRNFLWLGGTPAKKASWAGKHRPCPLDGRLGNGNGFGGVAPWASCHLFSLLISFLVFLSSFFFPHMTYAVVPKKWLVGKGQNHPNSKLGGQNLSTSLAKPLATVSRSSVIESFLLVRLARRVWQRMQSRLRITWPWVQSSLPSVFRCSQSRYRMSVSAVNKSVRCA